METAEYGIGEWDSVTWGNHRALVEVKEAGKAVKVRLPWRRCDRNAEKKGVFVRSQKTDRNVPRVYVKHIDREAGEIAFEAAVPGTYEIYYMRFDGTPRHYYPLVAYTAQPLDADPVWSGETSRRWDDLPLAELLRFEACGELHSFFPMEVTATRRETEELIGSHGDRAFLVFPEVREHPVRMANFLPQRWIEAGAYGTARFLAERGEYYAFQLALFAHKKSLEGLSVKYASLVGPGGTLDASRFTCFNLEGTDCRGRSFKKEMGVEKGKVQPLWIGTDIPADLSPGLYKGDILLECLGGDHEKVAIELEVGEAAAVERGDGEPEKHSRLRWLNSTLGSEEIPIKPYSPVTLDKEWFALLGRDLTAGKNGLPGEIRTFYNSEVDGITDKPLSLLAGPMELVLKERGSDLPWKHENQTREITAESFGRISQISRSGAFTLETNAILEPDGCLEYSVSLTAEEKGTYEDATLVIPLKGETVKYILGLGFTGGYAPESFDWKWDTSVKNQDALWLGTEQAGLQISLRDENYRRPLNTNFYTLQPLVSPVSWDNGGKGGISLSRREDGTCLVRCYDGGRTMEAGETLYFNFRLLITPFRPIDTDKQWNTRFCHKYGEPEEIRAQGATVINVHHANPVNPYINYPFLCPDDLKEYSRKTHDLGLKLRLYYTVRELTNHAPEIFALKSLGNEIFTKGPGGGHSWLQEHFHDDYIAAWHVFEYGCVAVANSGESRWHNYYVEGLNWLAEKMEIDGVYIDDLAFDRMTMKRVRRVLDKHREGALIDLHSANQFNEKDGFANSINMYMEHLPYLDRLWFGEYFDYSKGPDYWMTEVAGIPFGLMGEMLQDGGHLWRGMLYGMTSRYPHGENADPRPVWKVWNEFGMEGSRMKGYWVPDCPVKTSCGNILASVYEKEDSLLIALASWEKRDVKDLKLTFGGVLPAGGREAWELYSPYMEGHQKEETFSLDSFVTVPADQGRLLILRRK